MTLWQRAESVALAAAFAGFGLVLGFDWWWLLALFLVIDLSMLGYLKNPKVGAQIYNAAHNYVPPAVLLIIFLLLTHNDGKAPAWLAYLGVVWGFHVAVDRALGFGLKADDDFKHTHLGWIGTPSAAEPSHPAAVGLPAPVLVTIEELNGGHFTISRQQPLVIAADDPASWTASGYKDSVVEFTPGGVRETATFNPGFSAIAAGSTSVKLTEPSGRTLTFVINVK